MAVREGPIRGGEREREKEAKKERDREGTVADSRRLVSERVTGVRSIQAVARTELTLSLVLSFRFRW